MKKLKRPNIPYSSIKCRELKRIIISRPRIFEMFLEPIKVRSGSSVDLLTVVGNAIMLALLASGDNHPFGVDFTGPEHHSIRRQIGQ